jgi:hypothetical protein
MSERIFSEISVVCLQYYHYPVITVFILYSVFFIAVVVENTMNLGGQEEGETSGFFPYFMLLSLVCIIAYLVFHNKQKVNLAT